MEKKRKEELMRAKRAASATGACENKRFRLALVTGKKIIAFSNHWLNLASTRVSSHSAAGLCM